MKLRFFIACILLSTALHGMEYKPSKMELDEPTPSIPYKQRQPKSLFKLAGKADIVNQIQDIDPENTRILLEGLSVAPTKQLHQLKQQIIKKYSRYWPANKAYIAQQFIGHTEPVNTVAFNPAGTQIVTASDDATAIVWSIKQGDPLFTLRHADMVASAEFNHAGTQIVTASRDDTAKIWNAHSGNEIKTLKHRGSVISASYDPQDIKIVTACGDRTAKVWNAQTGALLLSLQHKKPVSYAQFNSKGTQIISIIISLEGTAHIWDANSGDELLNLPVYDPRSCAFNNAGTQIIISLIDVGAELFDARSGKKINTFPHDQCNSAFFNHDDSQIVTSSFDKTARIWDARTGKELMVLPHSSSVFFAAFDSTGTKVVTASGNNAYLWELNFLNKLSFPEVVTLMKMKQYGNEILADQFYKGQWDTLLTKFPAHQQEKIKELYDQSLVQAYEEETAEEMEEE